MISMEFKEPFLVSQYPLTSGLFGLHMKTAVLFDYYRMEFKEPFLVPQYPLTSGLFGLHTEQARYMDK